jgi:hypothetical protein
MERVVGVLSSVANGPNRREQALATANCRETSTLELTVNQEFSYLVACIVILTRRRYNLLVNRQVCLALTSNLEEALCYGGR